MGERTRGRVLGVALATGLAMAAGSAVTAAAAAEAPPAVPVTAAQREQAVRELAGQLRQRYCDAEAGEKAALLIETKLAQGGYDGLADAAAFALAVTADLQDDTGDRHLRLRAVPPPEPAAAAAAPADPAAERAAWRAAVRRGNYGLPRVEVLPGNVGLLELRRFQPPDLAGDTIVAAMAFLANADAMIVDLRNCRGGSTHAMPLFAGYFFASPVSLFDMEFRGDGITEHYWTLPWLPGRRLAEVPLYVATSGYTFSGAEAFAYRMQVLKRATIVGETTGGGANAGGGVDIGPLFRAYLPMGRPTDRDTGGNWEGTGVIPDVKSPARDAVAMAHRVALGRLRATAASDADRARLDLALEMAEALHHPVALAPAELERLAGSYGPYRVWALGGQLRVQRETEAPYLLTPLAPLVFVSETDQPVRVEFLAGAGGAVTRLVFVDDDGRREEAAR